MQRASWVRARWALIVAGGFLALPGCNSQATNPAVEAHRAKFVLASIPGKPTPIAHAREDVAEKPAEIVLAGVIRAGDHEPWDTGRAAFIIEDVAPHDHADEHDHDHGEGHDHDGEAGHADHDHDHAGQADQERHGQERGTGSSTPIAARDAHDHDHDHAHAGQGHAGHDHENCPFCDRAQSDLDRMAIVQFLGDDGEVIPMDARELFGLKKDQKVVVKGTAELDGLGTLILSAAGIFIEE